MTSIIEKRRSLHKSLATQEKKTEELKFQLSQMQALANIGITTCMIAHEMNNLLTPLSNYAALALQNLSDMELTKKAFSKVINNSERASKILNSMLTVANGQTENKTCISLSTLVDDIFNCLARDFAKDGIKVDILIPKDLTVYIIPMQIQQVLMNLILNARDAMMPRGGVLSIESSKNNDSTQITVSDTGCGIDPQIFSRIFDPFFTTKHKENASVHRSGAGLGLAFCKKAIDLHKGSITLESQVNVGTKFIITLPNSA